MTSQGFDYIGSRQYTLNSVKFGQQAGSTAQDLIGSYSRDKFKIELGEGAAFGMDTVVARFWTRILEGKAYSENLEVRTRVPGTWWQHLKLSLYAVLLVARWPFYGRRLVPQWVQEKFPVRYETLKSTVKLKGSYLYPQADFLTSTLGPVTIHENLEVCGDHYVQPDTASRFASVSEILNAFLLDPTYVTFDPATGIPHPRYFIDFLRHHGVNVDQLVPRNKL